MLMLEKSISIYAYYVTSLNIVGVLVLTMCLSAVDFKNKREHLAYFYHHNPIIIKTTLNWDLLFFEGNEIAI